MKVLTQNAKGGEFSVAAYPMPACPSTGALVAITCSAVSLGAEQAVYHLAMASPLQRARRWPGLLKQAWGRAKYGGLPDAVATVCDPTASPAPLGYSCCGIVLENGYRCEGFEPGDRVACAGLEFAGHAEVNAVPQTMMVKIPDGVSDEEACFATVASVPLDALRICDIKSGDTVLVLGLGLLGHLCAALADLHGAVVLGSGVDREQVLSARTYCPRGHFFRTPAALRHYSGIHHGNGVDHTFICAPFGGRSLFQIAGELTRDRGDVAVVGEVHCDVPHGLYHEKELQVKSSRAYGPGRNDPAGEREGLDFPVGYMQWTMQRDMGEILRLLSAKQLDIRGLVTHRLPIERAADGLKPLFAGNDGCAMGIVLEFPGFDRKKEEPVALGAGLEPKNAGGRGRTTPAGELRVGLIGAGRFAQGILIPAFRKAGIDTFTRIASGRGRSAVNAGKKFGAREAVARPDDIINDPDTNALLITTRHGQHADLICAGLEAGKHVFCETPLCLNELDLQRVENTVRNAPGIFMAGFNRRFSPFLAALKSSISHSVEPLALLYRINAGALPPDHWVHDEQEGGGRIVGEMCRYLDVAQFLIGAAPRHIQVASLSGNNAGRTYYDSLTMVVKYVDGSMATILFTANGAALAPMECLEVHRAGASAALDNFRSLSVKGQIVRGRKWSFSPRKGFVEEAKAFRAGCASGTPPIPMADMSTVTRLTFAAMDALRTGDPVELRAPGPAADSAP